MRDYVNLLKSRTQFRTFHIPLQSGSNDIKVNENKRRYQREVYTERSQ
jgi:tRNA A37 methylthiotransferase MiaB